MKKYLILFMVCAMLLVSLCGCETETTASTFDPEEGVAKEDLKIGLKAARRAPQFSKR